MTGPNDSLVLGLDVLDEVDDVEGVAELVAVPRNEFHKLRVQLDPGLGVEDGGAHVPDEIG